MYVPACQYVYYGCAMPAEVRRTSELLGLELHMFVKCLVCWELNPGPPREQHTLLPAVPSLQPQELFPIGGPACWNMSGDWLHYHMFIK